MLFHTLLFGQDPGTNLSAVRTVKTPWVMGRPWSVTTHDPV